jgi:glycosyltransferase involved in cell wall biosynthesis
VRVSLIGPLPPELGGATPGGVATHQAYLAAGLAAVPGLEVALLATNVRGNARRCGLPYDVRSPRTPASAREWLSPVYLSDVGPVRALAWGSRLASGGARAGSRREALEQLLAYRHFLAATRPDVVHAQHPLERAAYVREVAAREGRNWPLVVTAHSFFGEHADEVIYEFMAPNLRAADRVIAVSPHIAEQARQLGVDSGRMRVIRSGVDVERFRPRDRARARSALGVDPTQPLVLFVGNLEPRKQVDVLLHALVHLQDARLVVVGSGDSAGVEDQTARLHALAHQLGVWSRVRWAGRVDEPTLMDWYAAADVFALPSSSEAQGIVALEAMACGLPVVASAVGGLLGTIEDGQSGFLVPPGEPEPLAARVQKLLADAPRRRAVGAAARSRVTEHFTWRAAVAATVDVYRELALRKQAFVVPLGEAPRAEVERTVREHFVDAGWLDRVAVRRRPWLEAPRIVRRRYPSAVLVAPKLDQPRLAVTSLLLGGVRADERWRMDLDGRLEPFDVGAHLRRYGWPIVRHLAACLAAFVLAYPVLTLLRAVMRPRRSKLARPRHVLYLRSQLWLGLRGGGSVAHTAGVIDGLTEAGACVDVVSSDKLVAVEAPLTVVPPTTWFDGALRELEELAYNMAFLRAARRRPRPDLIYQRHTAFNVVGAVLSRLWRVPLVLEFNSSEVWKGRNWGGVRLLRFASLVEDINVGAADRIVVVSSPLRQSLIVHGVPASKVLVNPNGVDPARFRPDERNDALRSRLGIATDAPLVCFSGTYGVWHGIPTLARTLPKVLAERPSVRVVLLGDGPLRHLVEDLDERIVLPGLVPHAAVPAYLGASDILVSPHGTQADGGEFFGSPTKLFEYMAAGRAIVASAVGQIGEVLEDERTALLVPPDDPDALCQAIIRLVDDPALRARLGTAARQVAVAEHTWRQNADRLLASLEAR